MDDVPPDGGNGSDEEVTIDPEREAYYKSDPKKALHKFFEREGKCSTMVLCAPLPRVYCNTMVLCGWVYCSTMVLCGPLPRVYCSTMVLCGPLPRVYCSTMVLCGPLPRVYCSTMVLCGPLPRVYCSTMVLCGPLPRVYCSTMVLCGPLPWVYCSTMVLCGPLPRVYCSTMVLCGPLPRVYCSTMDVLYMFQFPHLPLLNLSPLPPPHSLLPIPLLPHSLLPIPLLKGLELEYETEESGTDRSISFTCRVRCVWGWCVMCVWRYVVDGVMCAYGGVVIHVLCLKIEETSW